MLLNEEENVWKRRFDKERGLRKEAERLLEVKSRELYELNLALEDKIQAATEELRQSNEELSSMVDYTNGQKDVLLYQHEEIKKSIDVAFAIQSSFLPSEQEILLCTNHYFILNMPRDIVSGDFYWIHRKERRSIFIVADCTGHGVPGAFMSLIGNALLNKIILDNNVFLPDHILFYLNMFLPDFFRKGGQKVQEGMDVSVCVYNHDTKILRFSGAMASLYYTENEQVIRLQGDRKSISGNSLPNEAEQTFTSQEVVVKPETVFYLTTDGYQDQFGGDFDKKITTKVLKDIFSKIYKMGFEEQKDYLKNYFDAWKGNKAQIDDVLVVGFSF
jgi:serine phosphatase RsbU (regulator of sigma subunit)